MLRWHVVRTHPLAEEKAAKNLAQQGYEAYLPRYLKRRSHARRIDYVPAPLFPRYVFVSFDVERHRWRSVRSTLGVADLVSFGDHPAWIPAAILDALRAREDDRGLIGLGSGRRLKPGESVKILAGAFFDQIGLFAEMTDDRRVVVLLDLLGRQIRVALPARAVAAAI